MALIIQGVITINCSYPSIFVLYVYFMKNNNIYFHFMLLQVQNSFVKTNMGLLLNNTPWHIAYAMVGGKEPKEFDDHSLKAYSL